MGHNVLLILSSIFTSQFSQFAALVGHLLQIFYVSLYNFSPSRNNVISHNSTQFLHGLILIWLPPIVFDSYNMNDSYAIFWIPPLLLTPPLSMSSFSSCTHNFHQKPGLVVDTPPLSMTHFDFWHPPCRWRVCLANDKEGGWVVCDPMGKLECNKINVVR